MKNLYLLLLFLLPIFCFGQFSNKKSYNIKKVNAKPKIDGNLDDEIWLNLDIADSFVQEKPNNGKNERKQQKTEVKIFYDDQYIYFGAMMYDNAPDSILKELGVRDDDNKNTDLFKIVIDPFNNAQIQYHFAVTASGVQIDKKISGDNNDKNWNAVWKSAVQINKLGWSIELAIPFSQLRFPNNNNKWALNIFRQIRRYRETYSWNPININFENYAIQSGLLDGIENIKSPIRLSFMPYASIYSETFDGNTNYPYNYGMDLKYGINDSYTLDMTLIPDFGQVASDAMVLNLSPFEIKYEENRQFFNEGIELFNKGDEMFYSRRLENDLINASKITGRSKKGLGIAILNAVTNKTDENPSTNYNVFIVDQALKNSSSVSLMNTNMINSNLNSNVMGVFTKLYNTNNTHLFSGKIKMSKIKNENVGFSSSLTSSNISGKYRYKIHTSIIDNNYNPNYLGFLTQKNKINSGLDLGIEQKNENKKFISSAHYLFLRYESLFTENKFVDFEIEAETKYVFKNYLFLMAKIVANPLEKNDYYEARTGDFNVPIKRSPSIRISTYLSSDYRNRLAVDFGCGIIEKPLYSSREYRARVSPRYRINDQISLKYVLSIKNKFNELGFVDNFFLPTEQRDLLLFSIRNTYMITNVFSGTYVISNKLDFSFKLRYHTDQVENLNFKEVDNKGYLINTNDNVILDDYNINYYTWTSDLSLNWWFAPGSQMSVVWKNGIDNETNNIQNSWLNNLEETFNMKQQNSLSVKIVYYLDYLYFKK